MNFTHNLPASLCTMTARVLVQVICVLAVACSVEAMPNVRAEYPDPENYNVVTLSCSDSFGNLLDDITFLKRVPGQMTLMPLSDNDVTLTQEGEGYFSCSSVSEGTSSEIGLAAEPSEDYDGTVTHRNITFPTADSSREVNLSCPIRPGTLRERCSVQWESSIPGIPGFTIVDTEMYSITEDIHPTSLYQYQCKVTIQHSNTKTETYNGPIINLNKIVLASIEDIQSVSVLEGGRAQFMCKFSKGDISDIDIYWTFDGDQYGKCGFTEDDIAPGGNGCYTNDTHSVLLLRNISSLNIGRYPVQCILQQNIPEDFKNDSSFQENFINSIISASLIIHPRDCNGTNCPPEIDLETSSPSGHTGDIVAAILIPVVVVAVMIMVLLLIIVCRRKSKQADTTSKSVELCEVHISSVSPQNESWIGSTPSVHSDKMQHSKGSSKRDHLEEEQSHRQSASPHLSHDDHHHHHRKSLNTSGSGMLTNTSVQQLQQDLSKKNMLFSKDVDFIELTKVIGQGESEVVYRGYFNTGEGKELVAIKTCKPLSSSVVKEKLLKEVTTMSLFTHPNVMPLIGLCFDGEMPLLIMPFMSNGNVLEYVKQNRVDLHKDQEATEVEVVMARNQCLSLCHQITKGMEYLARQKYVHRDLAARNCMIDSEGVIKVADFGLTEDMYGTNYFCHGENVVGSEEKVPVKWMAPESIEKNIYNEKTDVWSFGVTCWEVFTCGRVPYSGIPSMTLLKELLSGHRLDRPSNVICSDQIWEVMTCCWCAQSFQRPKFTHLVKTLSDLLEINSSYLKLDG